MKKKRARFLPCLAAFIVFSSCVASFLWFVPAVPASADYTTVQLTVGQTRALYGDTLSGYYYDVNSSDYAPCTFEYINNTTVPSLDARQSGADAFAAACPVGTQFLIYQSSVTGIADNTNSSYYSVQLDPLFNLGMLNKISFVAGFSSSAYQELVSGSDHEYFWTTYYEACASNTYATGYPKNYIEFDVNGNHNIYNALDRWTTNNNMLDWLSWAVAGTSQTNTRFFVPLVVNVQSDSYFSFQNLVLTRQGHVRATTSSGARTLLYISCPVLSQNYENNGSGGGGGSTGTDLTATNAKLDTIISILSMIANSQGSDDQTVDYLDSESPSDSSQLNNENSQFNNEYSEAQQDQNKVDSVVNRDNLDSIQIDSIAYDMDAEFNDLWEDGNGGTNELILGMCLAPITIAVISYILFGKRM